MAAPARPDAPAPREGNDLPGSSVRVRHVTGSKRTIEIHHRTLGAQLTLSSPDILFYQKRFSAARLLWIAAIIGLVYWCYDMSARAPRHFDGCSWYSGDKLSFTAFVTVLVGLLYGVIVDRSKVKLIAQWQRAGILSIGATHWDGVILYLNRIELKITGAVVAISLVFMATGYAWAFYLEGGRFQDYFTYTCNGESQIPEDSFALVIEFLVAVSVCSLLASLRLGRVVTHGFIGRAMFANDVRVNIIVEHPDCTGGLARVGQFYLLQSLILFPQFTWLVVWLYLLESSSSYEQWQMFLYMGIPAAGAAFVAIFWLPVLSFRHAIREWKRNNCDQNLAVGIEQIAKLTHSPDLTADNLVRRRVLVNYISDLNNLPDWPVSRRTRNAFISLFLIPALFTSSTHIIDLL